MFRTSVSRRVLSPAWPGRITSDVTVASTSRATTLTPLSTSITSLRTLHSSSTVHESQRKRDSRLKKQHHQNLRAELERQAEANKPHPALGYSPGKEQLWLNSLLYSILVKESDLDNLPIPTATIHTEEETLAPERSSILSGSKSTPLEPQKTGRMIPKLDSQKRPVVDEFELPQLMNFGIGKTERDFLFDALPKVRVEGRLYAQEPNSRSLSSLQKTITPGEMMQEENSMQYWLGRVLDLRNANAQGRAYENRKRIIATFSHSGAITDTGCPEVQVAILTERIHNLWNHIVVSRRDVHNRKNLMELIQARAKILRYLRRTKRARYEDLLPKIGVERGAVEGEIILTLQMFRDAFAPLTQ